MVLVLSETEMSAWALLASEASTLRGSAALRENPGGELGAIVPVDSTLGARHNEPMSGELLFLVVVAAAAGGFVYWRRRSRATPAEDAPSGPATVWNIGPGDLVEVEGTMMDVERALDCSEAGVTWRELLLADRDRSRKLWLAVEDDDGLVLTCSHPIDDPIDLESGYPRKIELDGVSYELEEKGRAQARIRAVDVPDRDTTFAYGVWLSHGGVRLTVEKWGGDVDWYRGEVVAEELVEVYGGTIA